jgi:hypothetical protein
MSCAVSGPSALESLQHYSSSARAISDADVQRAILDDLENTSGLNEVLITKFVRQANVSEKTLRDIIRTVQGRMHSCIDTDPTQFFNYTKVQLLLATELKRKANGLALALRS